MKFSLQKQLSASNENDYAMRFNINHFNIRGHYLFLYYEKSRPLYKHYVEKRILVIQVLSQLGIFVLNAATYKNNTYINTKVLIYL